MTILISISDIPRSMNGKPHPPDVAPTKHLAYINRDIFKEQIARSVVLPTGI